MTWTLHLYDDTGTEIGWATVDPHDYWVDESVESHTRIDAALDRLGSDYTVNAPTEWLSEDGAVYPEMQTVIEQDETPARERLERSAVSLEYEGHVASYELTDE